MLVDMKLQNGPLQRCSRWAGGEGSDSGTTGPAGARSAGNERTQGDARTCGLRNWECRAVISWSGVRAGIWGRRWGQVPFEYLLDVQVDMFVTRHCEPDLRFLP